MMRDFSASNYKGKKIAANKIRVQRKPLNLKKYLRPLYKVGLAITAIAVIYLVCLYFYRAIASVKLLSLKNIEVSNSKRITREEIIGLAGIESGANMLRMDLKLMGEHILRNPWVETVQVRRYLPDKLSITVTERDPIAVVNMGFVYYLDKKGNVFKVLNQGDRLDYPMITGFSEDDLSKDPAGTKEALKLTCELVSILREKSTFILADVSEIHYDKGYGFTMFTSANALPVKIGSGDFAEKIDRFSRVYKDLLIQRASLQYIDLDYNDKIVVRKS